MYQFSRSIYRELHSDVIEPCGARTQPNRERFLRSCEQAMERIALDRHYFARPSRSLFREVRDYFPLSEQLRVYAVITHHTRLATEYVDEHARAGVTFDGSPLCCHATTRRGTACQRIPLPGRKYCPSHNHLEEPAAVVAEAA